MFSAPQSMRKLSFGWKDAKGRPNEGENKAKRMTRRVAIIKEEEEEDDDDDDLKDDRKGDVNKVFLFFSIFPIPPGGEDEEDFSIYFRMVDK